MGCSRLAGLRMSYPDFDPLYVERNDEPSAAELIADQLPRFPCCHALAHNGHDFDCPQRPPLSDADFLRGIDLAYTEHPF